MENETTTNKLTATCSTRESSPRRVLGDLSTNAQLTPKSHSVFHKKSMTGTPLKRSYVASTRDEGFTYLKRRRLSYSAITPTTEELEEPAAIMRLPHEASAATLEDHPDDRESSTERHSFSSLINYDPSSQPSQARITRKSLSPIQPSRAEVLRLRLQMAMYKVRTKQTAVSFDYLREDTQSGSRESSRAVQEAVSELRREAYAKLGLDPGPAHAPRIALTPALPGDAVSPIRRFPYEIALKSTPARLGVNIDLSSSAVKGQVAEGLLGLKNGFR